MKYKIIFVILLATFSLQGQVSLQVRSATQLESNDNNYIKEAGRVFNTGIELGLNFQNVIHIPVSIWMGEMRIGAHGIYPVSEDERLGVLGGMDYILRFDDYQDVIVDQCVCVPKNTELLEDVRLFGGLSYTFNPINIRAGFQIYAYTEKIGFFVTLRMNVFDLAGQNRLKMFQPFQ